MAKHVVSVSWGRASETMLRVELFGEAVTIERRRTDGSVKGHSLISSLDGKVDAFGLGGIDRHLCRGRGIRWEGDRIAHRPTLADRRRQRAEDTLERWVIPYLQEQGLFSFAGKRILMVAAVDRFGMAEALLDTGADVMFGDVIFILGLPYHPSRSVPVAPGTGVGSGRRSAAVEVDLSDRRAARQVCRSTAITQVGRHGAGDFHLIKRYMPENMEARRSMNTVTPRDIEDLRRRGCDANHHYAGSGRTLFWNERSRGRVGCRIRFQRRIADPGMYLDLLQRLGFAPRIVQLTS